TGSPDERGHSGARHQSLGGRASDVDAGPAHLIPFHHRGPPARARQRHRQGNPTLSRSDHHRIPRLHRGPRGMAPCVLAHTVAPCVRILSTLLSPGSGGQIRYLLVRPSPAPSRSALRVLLVEDSEADATLIVHALQAEGRLVRFHRVDTADAFQDALLSAPWDVTVPDHLLPQVDAVRPPAQRDESALSEPVR